MSNCKHMQSEFTWSYGKDSSRPPVAFARHCVDCKERLSLGPSNDEPMEVKIEIRAAEIASGHSMGEQEQDGYQVHKQGLELAYPGPSRISGWLARQILYGDD